METYFDLRLRRFLSLGTVVFVVMLADAARRSPAATPATRPSATPGSPAAPAGMHRPMPHPVPDDPAVVTDEQVDAAIHRGADYLCARFDKGGPPSLRLTKRDQELLRRGDDASFETGAYGLAVYALLESGMAIKDPKLDVKRREMQALIEGLKAHDARGRCETYARGIRATALAAVDRPEDRDALMADAYWLVSVCDGGAYTYTYTPPVLQQVYPYGDGRSRPPPAAEPSLEGQISVILGKAGVGAAGNGNGKQPAPTTTQPDDTRAIQERPLTSGEMARQIALQKAFYDQPAYRWDNSNSQYGLLGVWSASEVGVEVPEEYWAAVDRHWTQCQTSEGSWPYINGSGKQSMTCAALASLMVTREYLVPPRIAADVGRDPYSPAIAKGLRWFERGQNSVTLDVPFHSASLSMPSYSFYAMERVGLISGFKHFGQYDWYKFIARRLVSEQQQDGSWGENVVDTAYCLLTLARGRHPVLMTKLRFDGNSAARGEATRQPVGGTPPAGNTWIGYWANRPRDAANLARYAGRQLERRFNWEVVNVALDWTEWNDSPVLELASHIAPEFTPSDQDKIRQYVLAGGMLFTQADGGSESFDHYAIKLAHDLFPQYDLVDVPAGHPIYTNQTVYNVGSRPPLKMVSNGSRVLMVHSPTDITRWWQQRDEVRHKDAFQLGVNLSIYAAGKRDYRNRLAESWVARPTAAPIATVKLARISYAGNWDPEPFAWRRYANWLQRLTSTRIETQAVDTADLETLDCSKCPLAHLTGTASQAFTVSDVGAIRKYVQSGGVLLIDQCGGTGTFDQSAEKLLAEAFPGQTLDPLPANHLLLRLGNPGTQDVTKPLVRPEVVARYGHGAGVPRILSCGKGHVLYTPLDITSGLLGIHTLGILGYDADYAQALVKNIVFWTLDGQKERNPQ